MKFNRKNTGIALVSILTAVTAISGSVRAERVQVGGIARPTFELKMLECKTTFIKEFTQTPVVKNTSNQTISAGKIIKVRAYFQGKPDGGVKSVTLSQPLAPNQTLMTGIQLQGDSGYTCKATY